MNEADDPHRDYKWRLLPPLERLMTRVVKETDGYGEHWMWTGARMGLKGEYGQTTLDRKRTGAHRAMWTVLRGPIPEGLDILHQCGRTLCINPDHVRPGTHRQNLAEALEARLGKHWAPKGEQHTHHKLTDGQVKDIRTRHANGVFQRVLAEEYGVSQPAISYIVSNKRWKHL